MMSENKGVKFFMQESRLFRMIYYLLEKGKSTAPELAAAFEVSVRTIYRDIDVISSAGIPIYATQGKNGGISIDKDFMLDRTMLSNKEKEQMISSLQGLSAAHGRNANELLTKLGALFHMRITNWIEVDFSDWKQAQPAQNSFNDIQTAILNRYIISFTYVNHCGSRDIRKIQPLKLIFKSKAWYVYGFCLRRNDYRLFKLTRIEQLTVSDTHFIPPEPIPAIDTTINHESLITVTLKFDKQMAFRVYDEFAHDCITEQSDGMTVTMRMPNNDILYSYILSFAEHAEIVEPQEIREHMQRQIKKIQAKYRT